MKRWNHCQGRDIGAGLGRHRLLEISLQVPSIDLQPLLFHSFFSSPDISHRRARQWSGVGLWVWIPCTSHGASIVPLWGWSAAQPDDSKAGVSPGLSYESWHYILSPPPPPQTVLLCQIQLLTCHLPCSKTKTGCAILALKAPWLLILNSPTVSPSADGLKSSGNGDVLC